MPLARRLSTSSHEAFTEFCSKNQPLSRRLSNSSYAASTRSSSSRRESISNDKGQRVLKRRNNSRTRTIARVTRSAARKDGISQSPEKKKQRVTRSRSTKRSSDKENAKNSNAGTPPWKAAKARGDKFSPRLTRSAKKKKLQTLNDQQPREGLLVFSPPDQAENARRQKMEFEKKLQKR